MDEYMIRVSGRLSEALLTAFPSLRAHPVPVQTALRGELPDQSALQGVLNRLDELGVEIVAVEKLPRAERTERTADSGGGGGSSRRLSIQRD
jgi:hypothetical protein